MTNWLGNRTSSRLSNTARSFDGAGGRIDLIVDRFPACRRRARSVPVRSNALTGKLAPARTRFITAGRLSSATVKITDIGCNWVTTTMPFGSLVLHVIAGVDLTQPDPAGHRRDDAAIGQVELLHIDLRLIGFDRRLVLSDERHLRIAGLPGDRVLRHQRVVPFEVELGVLQQRLVLGQRRLGLLERHLIGSRIDLGEEIALLDHLALFEGDLGQIAVDLGLYRDRGERGDGAELAQADRHVALLHRNHPDRHRTAGAPAPGFFRLRIGAGKYHTAAATIIRTNTQPEKSL